MSENTQIIGAGDLSDQIVELLAKTTRTPMQVAEILGCSPGFVSQVKQERMQEILSMKSTASLASIKRDNLIDELEDKALGKLKETLDLPFNVFKPMETLRVVQVLNGLQRRSQGSQLPAEESGGGTVVQIRLPKHTQEAIVGIKLNTNREVVEVNGRQMLNMPTQSVLQMVEERKAGRQEEKVSFGEKEKKAPHELRESDFSDPEIEALIAKQN